MCMHTWTQHRSHAPLVDVTPVVLERRLAVAVLVVAEAVHEHAGLGRGQRAPRGSSLLSGPQVPQVLLLVRSRATEPAPRCGWAGVLQLRALHRSPRCVGRCGDGQHGGAGLDVEQVRCPRLANDCARTRRPHSAPASMCARTRQHPTHGHNAHSYWLSPSPEFRMHNT